ncbi:MAG TPA: class I SAM-dependent methyltransferase [Thermoleophilaceae bacterium]|nr:class I SAM-dependent methyltransferase [Thermoleophilaceae bacterium]
MERQDGPTRDELEQAIGREWYHTIELAPGVVTPGWFDTRAVVPDLPFPASLEGKRCLDVATFDGFWAYEMESRGASEVHAIDVLDPNGWDWPVTSAQETLEAINRRKEGGVGFKVAHSALGSGVTFEERSVYDLDPDEVGEFDFVYVGSLLLHLRDPVRALERVRSVCRGQLLLVDNIHLPLTILHPRRAVADFDGDGRPWWWKANVAALVRMLRAAGFEPDAPPRRIYMPAGRGHPSRRSLRPRMLRTAEGRHIALTALRGDPHVAILAHPVG